MITKTINYVFRVEELKCTIFWLDIDYMLFQSWHAQNEKVFLELCYETSNFVRMSLETEFELSHVSNVEHRFIVNQTKSNWLA